MAVYLCRWPNGDFSVVKAARKVEAIEGAGFDQAHWNDGTGNFENMLARLRSLDCKDKNDLNQLRDILIAETAIKNGAILVSRDRNLRKVVLEFGGHAMDLSQSVEECKETGRNRA